MCGRVEELVVGHKDRLCRFSFDLVAHVLKQAGCRLLVVQDQDVPTDDAAEAELRDDLLSIITVFVASNNGRRAAAHKRARRAAAQEARGGDPKEEEGEEEEKATATKAPQGKRRRTGGNNSRPGGGGGGGERPGPAAEVPEVEDAPDRGAEGNPEAVDRGDAVGLQQGGSGDQQCRCRYP
jgi:hypothetical protein